MRYLYSAIVGISLCWAPSLCLAAPASGARPPSTVDVPAPLEAARIDPALSVSVDAKGALARSTDDRARYADKESQPASAGAQSFRGGDTLVIGSSVAVVILAVLLVLVII